MPTVGNISLPARWPALDGLRGIAILLVLLHQLNRIGGQELSVRMVEDVLDLGWVGVQLFFVLSGFLITGILLDSREAPNYLRSFFARRVLRILPLYFGALILILGVLPEVGLVPRAWRDHQLWYWLYLSNWTQPYVGGSLPHFWSLAVEEQFYLVWPFVILRFPPRDVLRLCIGLAAASLAVRAAMVASGMLPEAIYMFATSRIDALALGGAAAALLRLPEGLPAMLTARNLWRVAGVAGLLGLLVTRAYPRTSPLGQTVGYSVLAVVFASAILALALEEASPASHSFLAAWLRSAPLTALGTCSYGMYVLHKPLHDLVGKPALEWLGLGGPLGAGAGLAYVAIGATVTFLAGALSYWLFERHFLALKDRFAPAPAGP